ncbi:MAG TPA: hypothetical protein VGF39_09605, partial [Stellaceae bacterium]
VPAEEEAVRGIPGYLGAPGVNADPTVGSTAASLAQPPDAGVPQGEGGIPGGPASTASYSPYAKIVAGQMVRGQLGPADLTTAVNLGQSGTVGPGNTYAVRGAVGQANKMPYDLTVGTERHFPTGDGAGGPGGAVVSGPDTTSSTASTETAKATSATADKIREVGNAAVGAQAQLHVLKGLYDKLAAQGAYDASGKLVDMGVVRLAQSLGLPLDRLSDRVSAQKFIQSQMLGLLGQVRGAQGEPPLRGGIEAMMGTLPNPLDDPELFHAATDSLDAVLNHHIADGAAASAYKQSAMDKAAQNAFFTAQDRNAQAEAREIMKHPELIGKGDADLPVVNSPDEARKLGPGKKFRLPDGRTGTVPNG